MATTRSDHKFGVCVCAIYLRVGTGYLPTCLPFDFFFVVRVESTSWARGWFRHVWGKSRRDARWEPRGTATRSTTFGGGTPATANGPNKSTAKAKEWKFMENVRGCGWNFSFVRTFKKENATIILGSSKKQMSTTATGVCRKQPDFFTNNTSWCLGGN